MRALVVVAQSVLRNGALSADEAIRVAESIKRRWREGAYPEACTALREHPLLLKHKSIVIDLAYEEYCLREDRGETLDADRFCDRVPVFKSGVRSAILAHRLLADHPHLPDLTGVAWPKAGDTVEGMRVVQELGRGGFARAYLAFDETSNRPCVLKLSTGFVAEGKTLGPLNHPHVTPLYWTRHVGGFVAVCMPFLGISTLEDIREECCSSEAVEPAECLLTLLQEGKHVVPASPGRMPVVLSGDPYEVMVAAMAARIADALRYLHETGLHHGDLKPANVIVAPDGHPFLIDFNLAARDGPDAPIAGGTLPYMSSEAIRGFLGEKVEFDRQKCDVFSFGVLLFELLGGSSPWKESSSLPAVKLARSLLASREVEPTPCFPPKIEVSPVLEQITRLCLRPQAEERPAAKEIAARLELWIAAYRNRRRRVLKRMLLALSFLAALAGALFAPWGKMLDSSPELSIMEREPQTASEYYRRGRTRLSERNLPAALGDFQRSRELAAEPTTLAYEAYTLGLMANPMAIDRGRDACGLSPMSAVVHNNLGAALIQNSQSKLALGVLDKAVDLDPTLNTARYNRSIARYHVDLRGMQLSSLRCLDDIRLVLAANPSVAEPHFLAARMFAGGSHLDPSLRDKAIESLEAAVGFGDNPQRFEKEAVLLENLRGYKDFEKFREMPKPGTPAKAVNLRLTEPEGQ